MATYAALRLHVDSWRWADVPFYVRAGKSLKTTVTEVIVELKKPPQVVFGEPAPAVGNYVRFRLGPQVAIALGARAKQPGEGMTGRAGRAVGRGTAGHGGRVGDYERLLGDAMAGDATLFARQDRRRSRLGDRESAPPGSRPDVRVRARVMGTVRSRPAGRRGRRLEHARLTAHGSNPGGLLRSAHIDAGELTSYDASAQREG